MQTCIIIAVNNYASCVAGIAIGIVAIQLLHPALDNSPFYCYRLATAAFIAALKQPW